MAGQFDKSTILTKLQTKALAKGFVINPPEDQLPDGTTTMNDLLDAVAESLSEIISQDQVLPGTIKASSLKLGPTGLQQRVAYKNAKVKADAISDPKFFIWMETFHALLGAAYPEPGFLAPNVFNMALKVLLALKPTSITARIVDGSSKVKVTI